MIRLALAREATPPSLIGVGGSGILLNLRGAELGGARLALMLLLEARRASRTEDGVLVTLEDQDRSRWDGALIAEGVATLEEALAMRRAGSYQAQAAIAACHATAVDAASTDWPQIAILYGELARLAPSPVVDLNRAVAIAMADGIPAGLARVDELAESGGLAGYYLLPATRADLLRRDGRESGAAPTSPSTSPPRRKGRPFASLTRADRREIRMFRGVFARLDVLHRDEPAAADPTGTGQPIPKYV